MSTPFLSWRRPTAALAFAFALAIASSLVTSDAAARRRHVDVAFHEADVADAMRLLADAAHIGLVVEDGVSGKVSMRLRDVDPLDALMTIAALRGAEVRVRDGVAVVTKR